MAGNRSARRARAALLLGAAAGIGAAGAWAQEAAVGTEAEETATAAAVGLEGGAFVLDTLEVTAAPGTVTEELTLSVNNVLDENYASTGFYNTVIYGGGIGAELMLRARF